MILQGDLEIPEWWTNQSEPGKDQPEVKVFVDSGYVTLTGDTIDGFGLPVEETHQLALEKWMKTAWRAFNPDVENGAEPWANGRVTAATDSSAGESVDDESSGEYDEWMTDADVRDALSHISPDVDYDTWRNVGFALEDYYGSETRALDAFTEWSRGGSKWDDNAPYLAETIVTNGGSGRTIATVVDLATSAGWDPADRPSAGERATATADGGTAAEPIGVDADGEGATEPAAVSLSPATVATWAGLGEGEDVSDLNDRQKAATVWDLVQATDEYHVRVQRENGTLWAHDGGVWNPDGERALRHAARRAIGSMNYGQNVLAELEAQARGDPTVEVTADGFRSTHPVLDSR